MLHLLSLWDSFRESCGLVRLHTRTDIFKILHDERAWL